MSHPSLRLSFAGHPVSTLAAGISLACAGAEAFAQSTVRANVSTSGAEANRQSSDVSLSRDGRFVAFDSWATNLVANDLNGSIDVFRHDRLTSVTIRVSVAPTGGSSSDSFEPRMSLDGNLVVFQSWASNLVANDTNGDIDVFVRDVLAGVTTRVSVSSAGAEGNGTSGYATISDDGRYVAFGSNATTLVPGDTNAP